MRLLKKFEGYKTKDLYVGEIIDPQAYILDNEGNPTGYTKSISTNTFDVATRNAEGDYVSIVDGTYYSDGSYEKIVAGKAEPYMFFENVESFAEVTGCKRKRISKKAAIEKAKEINDERTKGIQL